MVGVGDKFPEMKKEMLDILQKAIETFDEKLYGKKKHGKNYIYVEHDNKRRCS